ncbi:MAG TPA: hypothetical protein HPP77_06540 [Candidatus Hydrogenedentes bacterium]|nr:hypothetical protein [Candidatus Hydrogenedentota bacterium]
MNAEATTNNQKRNSVLTWLFNPFYYLAGGQSLAMGIVVLGLCCLFGMITNSHFDGVLDFHVGAEAPWWFFWLESPIDWLIMGILLFIGGKLLSKSKVRAIDVFGTQALARFPALLMVLTQLPPVVRTAALRVSNTMLKMSPQLAPQADNGIADASALDVVLFGGSVLLVLVMLVWMLVLMYRAYAVSCNVKGAKAILLFIGLLLVGEIVSKIIILGILSASGL